MKSVLVKEGKLNLNKFLEEVLKSNKEMGIISYPFGVHWGRLENPENEGETILPTEPKFLNHEDTTEFYTTMGEEFKIEDTLKYLKENTDNYVFLNFSSADIYEPVPCIDGNTYGYENEEVEEEDEDDYFETKTCLSAESNSIGYFIQFEQGNYKIQSALYYPNAGGCSGPSSSDYIELIVDSGVFDEPMEKYLANYLL